MGTAANMNYVGGRRREVDEDVTVTAVVTAGVEGNATCAGEPATWRETDAGIAEGAGLRRHDQHDAAHQPAADAGGARARRRHDDRRQERGAAAAGGAEQLHVDLATGTGTDQYCIAAPSAGSTAADVGESAHEARRARRPGDARRRPLEALRWQNGLEASYTRGVFHALGRYGVKEATFFDDIAPLPQRGRSRAAAEEQQGGLLRAARRAPRRTRWPRCCDRVRYGTLPESVAADAIVQQAATLAANLAAQVHRWAEFRAHAAASCERRREDARAPRHRARMVREVAHRVIALLSRWRRIRCCWRWRRRRSRARRSRSTRGIRFGSSAGR